MQNLEQESSDNGDRSHLRVSRSSIIDSLRGQILRGQFARGARLPNRRDMVQRFGASSVTIQRAVDRLVADGFIYTDGPNGTFVARNPPNTSRYGLLLTSHPSHPRTWRRFATVLCDCAQDLYPDGSRKIAIYYDVDGKTQGDDYRRLVRDLRSHCLAGLIIVGEPDRLFGTPALEPSGPPRVALVEEAAGPNIPVVSHDRYSFINQALDYLRGQGRKNVAFIGGESVAPPNLQHYFNSALARRDMSHEPYWWQQVFVGEPQLARNLVGLLMHGGQSRRPDGLILNDDNLIEHVIAGLMDAGIHVPRDLELVTHCNFPWTIPSVMPIKRIGYDAAETLRLCVDLIDRQRAGATVELVSQVKPVEEDKLTPSAHLRRDRTNPRSQADAASAVTGAL